MTYLPRNTACLASGKKCNKQSRFLAFRFFLLSSLGILIIWGCAPAEWSAPLEKKADLVWPPPPFAAKVTYLGEITEFKQTGKSLKTLIFGRDEGGGLLTPVSVAVGNDGRMAIADLRKQGVHVYRPGDKYYNFIDRFDGERLLSPVAVVLDEANRLYVSDSEIKKVFVYDEKLQAKNVVTHGATGSSTPGEKIPFKRPTGLAHADGRLYVIDTMDNRIHVYGRSLEHLYSFGERGEGDGLFNMPTHIWTDRHDRIILNDSMNFRVQILDLEGHFFSKFGHHGDGSGDFAMSKGIAVDPWGIIYVVDTLFDAVQLFDEKGTFLLTIGSRGTEPGKFWLPSGLFIDKDNTMYICDTYNQRIQIFQLHDNRHDGGMK